MSNAPAAHTPACIAAATICAVENLRDSDNPAWTLTTPGVSPIEIGLGYLADGTTGCKCPPPAVAYRVTVAHTDGRVVGGFKVKAADRDAAKIEGVRAAVRHAKAYNARHGASFAANGVEWMLREDTAADYAATAVRKLPAAR